MNLSHSPAGMTMVLFGNIGLPMIYLYWPPAWLALIPIVLIEAFVGVRILRKSFRQSVCAASAANLSSTLLGIPLTWMALALAEALYFSEAKGLDTLALKAYAVTVQAPWLIPYEEDFIWIVPLAAIVLSLPFWAMSAISEYVIVKRFFPGSQPRLLWRWMWRGNAASYLLLVSLVLGLPCLESCFGWVYEVSQPITDGLVQTVFTLARLLAGAP